MQSSIMVCYASVIFGDNPDVSVSTNWMKYAMWALTVGTFLMRFPGLLQTDQGARKQEQMYVNTHNKGWCRREFNSFDFIAPIHSTVSTSLFIAQLNKIQMKRFITGQWASVVFYIMYICIMSSICCIVSCESFVHVRVMSTSLKKGQPVMTSAT